MILKLTAILSILCICCGAEWTIDLDYSFNDFTTSAPLGSIELRRNYDGNYTGSFKSSQNKEFGSRLFEAKDMAYSVRAKSSTQPGQEFLTTSKSCLLLQSNLFHLFWVSISSERQQLLTITVFPDSVAFQPDQESSTPPGSQECALPNEVKSGAPKGTVTVASRTSLPSPDTATFVQRVEKEKRAKQHGADADNRSFLAKYWMYILPVVIFAFISNAVNPEAQEGGGGGGAQ